MNKSNLLKSALFSITIGTMSTAFAAPITAANGYQNNNQAQSQNDQSLSTNQGPYLIPIPKSSSNPALQAAPTTPQTGITPQPNLAPAPKMPKVPMPAAQQSGSSSIPQATPTLVQIEQNKRLPSMRSPQSSGIDPTWKSTPASSQISPNQQPNPKPLRANDLNHQPYQTQGAQGAQLPLSQSQQSFQTSNLQSMQERRQFRTPMPQSNSKQEPYPIPVPQSMQERRAIQAHQLNANSTMPQSDLRQQQPNPMMAPQSMHEQQSFSNATTSKSQTYLPQVNANDTNINATQSTSIIQPQNYSNSAPKPQSYQQPFPSKPIIHRNDRSEFWDNNYRHHRMRPISNWIIIPNYASMPETVVIGNELSNNYYYVCQAYYQGSLIPGKLVAGNCNIAYNGQEIVLNNYRLLSGQGYQWEPAIPETIPSGAVIGGYESNGQPLYVCRAQYRGEMHPGKIVDNRCNFGWGGRERSAAYYEVLTY